jgi:hypothetical protein
MTTESSTVETDLTTGQTATSNDGAATNSQTQDVQSKSTEGQDSSTGQDSGAKSPSTALEAAKLALAETRTEAESPPAQAGTKTQTAEPTAEADKASAIDKAIADKSLPFHTHPRWKEVTSAAKALEANVEAMAPKAEKWDALDAKFRSTGLAPTDVEPLFEGGAMLKRAGVSHEEIGVLMQVGAALKLGDREVFKQLASRAIEALGLQIVDAIPADIQSRIEQGALSEEDGKRLADVEFNARRERALRERAESRVHERETADSMAERSRRFEAASVSWEARTKATDADWDRKEPHIVEAIKALVRQRPPQDEREVEAICQMAYDQVTRIMRTAAPPQRPRVSPATGGSSTSSVPVPKTALEAAMLGLRRANANV